MNVLFIGDFIKKSAHIMNIMNAHKESGDCYFCAISANAKTAYADFLLSL